MKHSNKIYHFIIVSVKHPIDKISHNSLIYHYKAQDVFTEAVYEGSFTTKNIDKFEAGEQVYVVHIHNVLSIIL